MMNRVINTIKLKADKLNLKKQIHVHARDKRNWIAVIVLSGILALFWDLRGNETQSGVSPGSVPEESAATFIPEGYVLVPIEVSNYESLDSILGQYGVVDLFVQTPEDDEPSRKVAERVKILRAPLNPSHFAVLVPENESQNLVTFDLPFTVVVQNPNSSGTKFVSSPKADVEKPLEKQVSPHSHSRISVEINDGV